MSDNKGLSGYRTEEVGRALRQGGGALMLLAAGDAGRRVLTEEINANEGGYLAAQLHKTSPEHEAQMGFATLEVAVALLAAGLATFGSKIEQRAYARPKVSSDTPEPA